MSMSTTARQTPINNTIQVNVRPGDETGLYYILLSNLPWQTSWQQLKDHVRTVCSGVERVEIFNESTSGWVCVRGRENFSAAKNLLEQTPFNGRPIWADGRNATMGIPIRKLVGTPDLPGAAPRSPRTPRTAQQMTQYPTSTAPMFSSDTPQYTELYACVPASIIPSATAAYGFSSTPAAAAQDFQNCEGWYPSYTSNGMDASVAMPVGTATFFYPTYQDTQPDIPHENKCATATSAYKTGQESRSTEPVAGQKYRQECVETEHRKIIVKELVKWAQYEHLEDLLRSRCGFSGDEVTDVEIPQSKDGGNRGHATITFISVAYAARAIHKLHKHKFNGKALNVSYSSEGVSKNEGKRKNHNHSSRHHREDREERESSKSTSAGHEKKEKSVKKGAVIIANGSSKKASESSKKSR